MGNCRDQGFHLPKPILGILKLRLGQYVCHRREVGNCELKGLEDQSRVWANADQPAFGLIQRIGSRWPWLQLPRLFAPQDKTIVALIKFKPTQTGPPLMSQRKETRA